MTDEFLKEVATKIATSVGKKLAAGNYLPLSEREETMVTEAANSAAMSLLDILIEGGMLSAPIPPGVN
jgi:hypothetical protein